MKLTRQTAQDLKQGFAVIGGGVASGFALCLLPPAVLAVGCVTVVSLGIPAAFLVDMRRKGKDAIAVKAARGLYFDSLR